MFYKLSNNFQESLSSKVSELTSNLISNVLINHTYLK